jgi:hypothetical protein
MLKAYRFSMFSKHTTKQIKISLEINQLSCYSDCNTNLRLLHTGNHAGLKTPYSNYNDGATMVNNVIKYASKLLQ